MALGGGPSLVIGGKARSFTGTQPRHPRTALGWNKDYFSWWWWMAQRNLSVGMSLPGWLIIWQSSVAKKR